MLQHVMIRPTVVLLCEYVSLQVVSESVCLIVCLAFQDAFQLAFALVE